MLPLARTADMKTPTVTVEKFYQSNEAALRMKLVAGERGLPKEIREPTVNRPGLALTGFTKYFAHKRVQVMGNAERHFMNSLDDAEAEKRYRRLYAEGIPCLVFCRGHHPPPVALAVAEELGVPVFRTPLITMKFINLATLSLEMMFAPHGTELGSMVDILGVGVIVRGESGIGKSESVLALIERGYSLVADDVTKVTLVDGAHVIGTSSEVTRDHMEVRGIGIINVAAMFGVRSIRRDKEVDLVISLKSWDHVEDVDRLGMEDQFTTILGVKIPHVIIPVRPGRDLARLIEVAAFQAKLKSTGFNAAAAFNERLIARMTSSG